MVTEIFLILFLFFDGSSSLRILLIGDSVDRMITEDWCWNIGLQPDGSGGKVWDSQWADGSMRYGGAKGKKIPAYICGSYVTNDSIAFVHTFGSNPTGPYFQGFTNSREDPNTDSPSRIAHAMELYYKTYPVPDIIYYNSVQWDLQLEYTLANDKAELETPYSLSWNKSVAMFEKNVNDRLNEIVNHTIRLSESSGKIANVGIRTALFNPTPSVLQSPSVKFNLQNRIIRAYNDILRAIATQRNFTLYDMDNDIWSTVAWDYNREQEVMRDYFHPNAEKAALAAKKLLQWKYSSFSYNRAVYADDANLPTLWLGSNLQKPTRVQEVQLVSAFTHCYCTIPEKVQDSIQLCTSVLDYDQPFHCNDSKATSHGTADDCKFRIYFLTQAVGSDGTFVRHGHVNDIFLVHLGLGEAYVLYTSSEQLERLPLGKPIPSALSTATDGIWNTTSGHLYLVRQTWTVSAVAKWHRGREGASVIRSGHYTRN
jgi:hypothetical protein